MTVPVKFFKSVGTRAWLRVYWGRGCGHPDQSHDVQVHLMDSPVVGDWQLGGDPIEYDDSRWPTACVKCAAPVPPEPDKVLCDCGCGVMLRSKDAPTRQVFRSILLQGPSGEFSWRNDLPIGAAWIVDWHKPGERCHHNWTNCDGKHLYVKCPDGHWWDVDGRASNCSKPNDTTHRCWVRHGDLASGALHVDKNGETCTAGAGSIQTKNYHGFLHNGVLKPC